MAWIYGVDQVDSYQSEIGADQRSAPTTSRVKLSKAGGSGCGVSAAWMPRPSPHGRVYGVPRNRTHPAIPRIASL